MSRNTFSAAEPAASFTLPAASFTASLADPAASLILSPASCRSTLLLIRHHNCDKDVDERHRSGRNMTKLSERTEFTDHKRFYACSRRGCFPKTTCSHVMMCHQIRCTAHACMVYARRNGRHVMRCLHLMQMRMEQIKSTAHEWNSCGNGSIAGRRIGQILVLNRVIMQSYRYHNGSIHKPGQLTRVSPHGRVSCAERGLPGGPAGRARMCMGGPRRSSIWKRERKPSLLECVESLGSKNGQC